MEKAALEATRLLAIEMGFEENSFLAKFYPEPCTDLKPIHYPKPDASTPIMLRDHFDTGFITLLTSLGYEGLQLQLDDDTWMDVSSRPGSVVVNIGEALAAVSKGRFKATRHRVRNIGEERYSLPYFFRARFDAQFDFLKIGDSEVASTLYGPWAIKRLKANTRL